MSEEKTTAVEETVSETPAKETIHNSSNDSLIAESKKYRNRAQVAEAQNSEYEKKLAEIENERLKNAEDKAEYIKKLESDVISYKEKAEKHDLLVKNSKNELLELHPENERESLSKLDLKTLKYVTSKINNIKPNAPEVVGTAKRNAPTKPVDWSDKGSLKQNWGNIIDQYKQKPKKRA